MRLLSVVNFVLIGVILFITALFIFSKNEEEYSIFVPTAVQKELPKSPFCDSDDFFQDLGEGLLALKWVPPQMQLPDLRGELLFYGKNARPDSLHGKSSFHFQLKGSGERILTREGEKTYLVYQGTFLPKETRRHPTANDSVTSSPRPIWGEVAPKIESSDKTPYVFSPGNQPTPLWFEARHMGENVEVRISMLDEKGALVTSPNDMHIFQLQAQEFPKAQMTSWEIGNFRVDATLLVRQKARWMGPDLFLELHGGSEFVHAIGKERIDFFEGPHLFSCFISAGDFLVWRNDRWEVTQVGEETQHLPLLVVKKIEEKIISFELWDPEGKGRTLLSLIRAKDHHGLPNISQEFKFVGAKTWAQFIVECRSGGRMTLKPHDWLVLTPDGWIKLDSPSQIDAFVNQTISGPLFILDKMAKKNGRQVLLGHLFNTSRTEVEHVELTSAPAASLANFYRNIPLSPPIQPKNLEIQGGTE